ncbi:DUF6339 family protein [Actinoplanes sp. NEAU-A12]|uniref:DUF6339 family protein n=1 Tax=Actinoplanes sandaracinus TaxID=3045177 RepID=A0ABT6WHM9_9ACTN|nr:DUF6339 family protein [Actinoplanes sandaracinus]MDI6099237.1 DUF6339 family protein [Actinoplanes sandaracinus]
MTLLLYPRLTPLAARAVLAEHTGKTLEALRRGAELRHPDMYYAATGGEPAGVEHLTVLADKLRGSVVDHGYPNAVTDAAHISADRALAAAMIDTMRLRPSEAAAKDLWTFLAVGLLPDVVAWRWQSPTSEQRWICSDITRHALGRLWWQAYTLGTRTAVGTTDTALLQRLSESDLNQIFERRAIGGRPALARAIARAVTDPDLAPPHIARRRIIRDVTKRVRRLLPFTLFLTLPDERLQTRIDDLVRESVKALEQTPRRT